MAQRVQPDYEIGSTPGELQSLIRHFYRSPGITAQEIRELLDRDGKGFCNDAVRLFRTFDGTSAGTQFLIGLLLERGLLIRTLCDSTIDADHTRALLTAALATGSDADLVLGRGLAETAQMRHGAVSRDGLLRVLNLLEQLTDPNRITPRLLSLLRHPDGHLRSKVVLMVGRCGKNVPWARRQLADADPRTRANAMEALWGREDREARELLDYAARDTNNRVASNALMGMYLAGDSTAIERLLEMAGRTSPAFRASAAWAMGNTGDPRFLEALQGMDADRNALVRRVAGSALKRIQAEVSASAEERLQWRAAAFPESGDTAWNPRRIRLALQYPDGGEPPSILPTHFLVAEFPSDGGERLATEYSVEENPVAEKLAIALVFPTREDRPETAFLVGAMRALYWKRPQDAWAPVPYTTRRRHCVRAKLLGEVIEIAAQEEEPPPLAPPSLLNDPDLIAAACEDATTDQAYPGLWAALSSAFAALRDPVLQGAEPHVIVYSPEMVEPPGGGFDAGIAIHGIARADDEALREICHRSGGTYRVAWNDGAVTESIERVHVSLLARYRIAYESGYAGAESEIRIRTPSGWTGVPVASVEHEDGGG